MLLDSICVSKLDSSISQIFKYFPFQQKWQCFQKRAFLSIIYHFPSGLKKSQNTRKKSRQKVFLSIKCTAAIVFSRHVRVEWSKKRPIMLAGTGNFFGLFSRRELARFLFWESGNDSRREQFNAWTIIYTNYQVSRICPIDTETFLHFPKLRIPEVFSHK